MEAEEGKRVSISFICKLEGGTISDIALRDPLEFVIGQGNTLPSLETGVLGMKAGDCRTIRVPAAEVEEFPFNEDEAPTEAHFPAGAGRIPNYSMISALVKAGMTMCTWPSRRNPTDHTATSRRPVLTSSSRYR